MDRQIVKFVRNLDLTAQAAGRLRVDHEIEHIGLRLLRRGEESLAARSQVAMTGCTGADTAAFGHDSCHTSRHSNLHQRLSGFGIRDDFSSVSFNKCDLCHGQLACHAILRDSGPRTDNPRL